MTHDRPHDRPHVCVHDHPRQPPACKLKSPTEKPDLGFVTRPVSRLAFFLPCFLTAARQRDMFMPDMRALPPQSRLVVMEAWLHDNGITYDVDPTGVGIRKAWNAVKNKVDMKAKRAREHAARAASADKALLREDSHPAVAVATEMPPEQTPHIADLSLPGKKRTLPSSDARRIRRAGKHEVAAKQLAMLMGEIYRLPLQKRGRKPNTPAAAPEQPTLSTLDRE